MKTICFVLLLTICLINPILLRGDNQLIPAMKLLPNLDASLDVEFSLPENYVLLRKEVDPEIEYLLGPKDLDKSFFDNPKLIKQPLISVIKKSGFKSFKKNIEEMISQLKQQFPREFFATFSQWGDYPLVSIKMTVGMDKIYVAYVGLNDDDGNVLMFYMIYPSKAEFGNGNIPRKEDVAFWMNFLNKTKSLNTLNVKEETVVTDKEPMTFQPASILERLAVKPAVPANFVEMSVGGGLDPYEWIYWGPQDVLQAYFKNEKSLSQAIIGVTLGTATQQEFDSISEGEWKKAFQFPNVKFSELRLLWGNYPVYSVQVDTPTEQMLVAWVGLNFPEGTSLLFKLVYPETQKKPNKQDRELWDNFLKKTMVNPSNAQ